MRIEQHRARRPRGCAGRVLTRPRRAVGRCWRGHGGRERAEKKKDWEGALGAVLFFPPLLMARVGAGGAGFDRGVSQEHGYRPEANGDSEAHSRNDFCRFLSARCSTKSSQEIQIRIFEIFHFR
jgi:hypothetical protein